MVEGYMGIANRWASLGNAVVVAVVVVFVACDLNESAAAGYNIDTDSTLAAAAAAVVVVVLVDENVNDRLNAVVDCAGGAVFSCPKNLFLYLFVQVLFQHC